MGRHHGSKRSRKKEKKNIPRTPQARRQRPQPLKIFKNDQNDTGPRCPEHPRAETGCAGHTSTAGPRKKEATDDEDCVDCEMVKCCGSRRLKTEDEKAKRRSEAPPAARETKTETAKNAKYRKQITESSRETAKTSTNVHICPRRPQQEGAMAMAIATGRSL